jgi:hypothetical protein
MHRASGAGPTAITRVLLKVFGRTATPSNHQSRGSLSFSFCEAPIGWIGNNRTRNLLVDARWTARTPKETPQMPRERIREYPSYFSTNSDLSSVSITSQNNISYPPEVSLPFSFGMLVRPFDWP